MRVFEKYADYDAAMKAGTFRLLPEYAPASFKCSKCGAVRSFNFNTGGTGYAVTGDQQFLCYTCSSENEVSYLLAHGRGHLYFTGSEVTDWPGMFKVPARVETGTKTTTRFSFVMPGENKRWLGSIVNDGSTQLARVWRSVR